MGEGFRVRAKTTVLNLDEVYLLFYLTEFRSQESELILNSVLLADE